MPSLYRKWRSRSFDDLVGQDHVVRTLRNAVSQHRIAHAYLFTGPRGTGKTSMARILAKAVNCLNPRDGSPCNECEMCVAANEGRAMDVIEIDAASNTSVENVRDLRERVAYAAGEGRFKVYIVDEVHRLSGAAFDAFLKTLEEPPPHVIFVFASTEPHKVPETITSRCQRFDFRRIPAAETRDRLLYVAQNEGLEVEERAVDLIAQQARGSLRDALGLLDQVAAYTEQGITDAEVRAALGLADATLIARLTDAMIGEDIANGLGLFHDFVDAGGDPRLLTRQLIEYWRSLLLAVSGVRVPELALDPALTDCLPEHSARLSETQVVAVLRALVDQEFSAKFNVPAPLPFEMAYVQASIALRGINGASAQRSTLTSVSPPPVAPVNQTSSDTPPASRPSPPHAPPRAAAPAASTPVNDLAAILRPAAPEPAPAEQPATNGSSAAPAGTGSLDLTSVEARWPDVVRRMRDMSLSLEAVLRSGHVLRVANGEITVGFEYVFHRDVFSDNGKRKMLEQAVSEVLGATYRVNCIKASREEIQAVRGAEALDEDDGFMQEAAERLRAYHVRELGNGRS